jgi:redox-sensitive bicupin YhaK (pirin superfamily)
MRSWIIRVRLSQADGETLMSFLIDPQHPSAKTNVVIEPITKDLGGFRVRRALPHIKQRMVGPFIFLDQMGPAIFPAGEGLDVRPHPHIGLATLTYLVEGSIFHRDTLGNAQNIVPGDINWMTAGRGIAHSERSSAESRKVERQMTGVQSWLALPRAFEETEPAFFHHDAGEMPVLSDTGISLHLVAGEAYGAVSPVRVFCSTLYADVTLAAGAAIPLPDEHAERAIYLLSGSVEIGGEVFATPLLLAFRPGDPITIRAQSAARFIMLGGEPLDGPRHLWWNFVSSSNERIEQAKLDWTSGAFGVVPGDEKEWIPLPG